MWPCSRRWIDRTEERGELVIGKDANLKKDGRTRTEDSGSLSMSRWQLKKTWRSKNRGHDGAVTGPRRWVYAVCQGAGKRIYALRINGDRS